MTDLAAMLSFQLRAAKIEHQREVRSVKNSVKPNKDCEKCGAPFYAAPSHVAKGWGRFCSETCARSGKENGRYKECNVYCRRCGKAFHVKASAHDSGKAKVYCSVECRRAAQTAQIICPTCSQSFSVPRSHAKRSKFCSRECLKKSFKNSEPNRVCVTCKKLFYAKASELERGRNIGTFCSVRCMTRSRGKIVLEDGKYASHLEQSLFVLLKDQGLLKGATREFRFHPKRRWLFDFAWPELKVAVEVQGGIWLTGRSGHASGAGRARDAEKLNEATVHGWSLLEVTSNQIKNGLAIEWIRVVLSNRGYRV